MTQSKVHRKFTSTLPWLDVLALCAWGALLLKYWLTGQLSLLIHPNYFGLVFATGAVLLILGGVRAWQLRNRRHSRQVSETVDHITLFPVGWASGLLIVSAILGLAIAPAVLTSQTALQRGISDLPLTRAQPQSFRMSTQPEERSLIEWVRTLNAYPEPDAYVGQESEGTGVCGASAGTAEQLFINFSVCADLLRRRCLSGRHSGQAQPKPRCLCLGYLARS